MWPFPTGSGDPGSQAQPLILLPWTPLLPVGPRSRNPTLRNELLHDRTAFQQTSLASPRLSVCRHLLLL